MVLAVPGLDVGRAMRAERDAAATSTIETARDAEWRPNDASIRGLPPGTEPDRHQT